MLDFIVNPFITILLFLYRILGGNVVLSIVVFTVLVRLAIYPLTLKQQRSTKAMQELQPELKKLQEKHKNDRERLAQAQWELYRQHGVNPMAGCLTLIIQLPIMLALYRAIIATLAATPLELLQIAERIWVPELSSEIPLRNQFLWLNLGQPDPFYILPILVVVTTWLQQKLLMPDMSSSGGGDKAADQAANMSRQMMMIMPIMFGIFALSFASGLSIYFIASNLIGIVQYAAMGKIDVRRLLGRAPQEPEPAKVSKRKPERALRDSSAEADNGRDDEPVVITKPKRKRETSSAPLVIKPKRGGVSDTRAERARAKK